MEYGLSGEREGEAKTWEVGDREGVALLYVIVMASGMATGALDSGKRFLSDGSI